MTTRAPGRMSVYAAIVLLVATIFTNPYSRPTRQQDGEGYSYQSTTPRDDESRSLRETVPATVEESSAVASPASAAIEFPAFMRQWKPPSKSERIMIAKGENCNIHDTSIPHLYVTTNHPTSYNLTDVFRTVSENFEQAWRDHDTTNRYAGQSMPRLARPGAHLTASVNTSTTPQSPTNSSEVKVAVCSIVRYWITSHFPHQMQHILPCWSFWHHFPNAKRVLNLHKGRAAHFTNSSTFSRGVRDVLEASGVSIVVMKPDQYFDNHVYGKPEVVSATPPVDNFIGYKATHQDAVRSLRSSALAAMGLDQYQQVYCSANHANDAKDEIVAAPAPRKEPRIVIIDRETSRTLIGAYDIAFLLQKEMGLSYVPPVVYFEDLTFAQQVEAFANADILVTAHGAHLAGLVFMNRCSSLIEVLPHGYGYPTFFGTMAALSGVNHSYVYLGTNIDEENIDPRNETARLAASRAPMCPPAHVLVEATRTQIARWRQCCGFTSE